MRKQLGGCGETSELTAARSHRVISWFYTVAAAGLAGALVVECIMIGWHRVSSQIHLQRAMEQG